MKGIFVVIDGADGSGKATQTKLLYERLRKEKIRVKKIDFPRYYNNVFGKLIGECLAGERGDFVSLDPYIASSLYALDRFESSKTMEKWLQEGYLVIADRYVSSNQMHQAGKISDPKKRKEFLRWIQMVEFNILKIPKPDLIAYLDVPIEVSLALLKKNKKALQQKKRYLRRKADVVESNVKYLKDSRKSALDIVSKNNKWMRVPCIDEAKNLLPAVDIHDRLYTALKKRGILKQ